MVGGTLKDLVLDAFYGVPGKPLYNHQVRQLLFA